MSWQLVKHTPCADGPTVQQAVLYSSVQETIEWLSHPENYDPDITPPGLENFDPIPILMSALPITTSVAIVQFSHEIAHRLVAWQKKVRYLGPSSCPHHTGAVPSPETYACI